VKNKEKNKISRFANSILGRALKTNSAFTLIELLAIIVILAIIAVITVPIILNVIDNAKRGTAKDSAYGYKDAINKYYVSELYENNKLKLNGDYTINDKGNLSDGIYSYEIPFNGNTPKGGNLTYENNVLKNGCITIDEYKVTIENGDVETVEKGTCEDVSPTSCSLESSPEEWFTFNDTNNPGKITGLQLKDETHPNGYNGEDTIKIPCYKSDGTKITHIGHGGLCGIQLDKLIISDSIETIQDGPLNGVNIGTVIFGKNLDILQGGNFGSSTLGKVIFTNSPKMITDSTFSGSTIDELVLGESINSFTPYVFKNIQSINTIYNSENKVVDWNYLLNQESSEPFNIGVVNKNGVETVIKSNDSNLKNVDDKVTKQIAREVDGVKYYNAEWVGQNPVYFNPVDYTKCTEGTNNCKKWYAYSENSDGTVNMILDHNTTPHIAWVTSEHYGTGIPTLATSLGITYPNGNIVGYDSYGSYGNWNKGPITLLNQLKSDTNDWSNELVRSDSYTNKNNYNNNGTVIERYTINYSGYKARLITAQEIANIRGLEYNEETSASTLRLNLDTSWLLSNLSVSNTEAAPYGYWTSSSYASSASHALKVSYDVYIDYYNVFYGSRFGVRPVITISKSNL